MKTNKFKAAFLLCLIIALPIYTAEVFAVHNLQVDKVSGEDGLEGFMREYDRINIEASADVDGDSQITPDQLRVNSFEFDECANASVTGQSCYYTSSYISASPQRYDLEIKLVSDSGEELRSTTRYIEVDHLAPAISFTRDPVQHQDNVSLSFAVTERAREDSTSCSGLDKIEIWDGSEKLEEITDISGCEYSEDLMTGIPRSGRITIKAYDLLDQMSSKTSREVVIDDSAPEIIEETFSMKINSVEVGEYIGSGEGLVSAEILIKEESITGSDVSLDLSELGGRSSIPADSCTKNNNHHVCRWNSKEISTSTDTSASITVDAEDRFGNSDSKTISRTFEVDATSPVVDSITTNRFFGDKSYIGKKPVNITLKISESGSGISKENIMLDLSDLGAYGIIQADSCNRTGSLWTCIWEDVKTTKTGEKPAVIYVIDAADNAGNPLSGTMTESIYIDTNTPSISPDITITPIAPEERSGDYIVAGDDLEITLSASDNSLQKVYADFSDIYNANRSQKIAAECTGEDSKECTFSIGPLASGYSKGSIIFSAEDAAGNVARHEYPIEVFGKDDEENPDYWGISSIEPMPPALDRQTTPLIQQRVYYHLDMNSPAGASMIGMNLIDCTGAEGYISRKKIFNDAGSQPYLMIEIKKTSADVEKIDFECILEITSLYNNHISKPETETVPLSIKFYNMPLGEASSELQNKIDGLYDTYIDGWWQVIGGLNTLLEYSKLACNLIYTFRQVVTFISLVKQGLGNVENLDPTQATRAARIGMCLKTEAVKKSADNTFESLDKFCNFVNCRMSRPEGKVEGLEEWGQVLGGGGGLDLNNWLGVDMIKDFTGKTPIGGSWRGTAEYSRYSGYMNPKDSLVLSLLTMCLPGIIYNLKKYREIQCGYINCLEESTRTGVPADACDRVKEYQTCKYLYGEIFQAIPFTAFYDHFVRMIKNALSDPFSVVSIGLGAACAHLCTLPTDEPHELCIWSKIFAELGDIISNVENMLSGDYWDVQNTYCHDVKERHENKESAGQDHLQQQGYEGLG